MNAAFLICIMLSQNPQQFLQAGEVALEAGQWQEASDNFNKAIGTNVLNIGGQTISYWNIYIAEQNLGDTDESMMALLAFNVYGADWFTSENPRLKIMATQFNVKRKLIYGIAMLQAVWAHRNKYSCRSELFACFIPAVQLIRVFEEQIPFCGDRSKIVGGSMDREGTSIRMNVKCPDKIETYYFTTTNEL